MRLTGAKFHPDDRVRVVSYAGTHAYDGRRGWIRGGRGDDGWYEVELDDMSDVEPDAINRMLHSILFNEDELDFSD